MSGAFKTASRVLEPFQRFTRLESASGLLLLFAAAIAFAWANSPAREIYHAFRSWSILKPPFAAFTLEQMVNNGFMAAFFLLVGLEIKREMLAGELASFRKSALPMAAAVGGMLVPAGIYAWFNHGSPAASGWGIPMATDIAFALGALTLLGKRIPQGLKVFLVALAIIDDIGAILVIAIFYTQRLHFGALALAGICIALLFGMKASGVRRLFPYLGLGILLWWFLLLSGIHATLAGVVLAGFIPYSSRCAEEPSLQCLERLLHPWVSFGVLPLFALVNAGAALIPETRGLLIQPPGLGIIVGLCLGKPVGITLFSWLAVRLRFGALPDGARWNHLLGTGLLGGIGFTMSLFIADLGLPDARLLEGAKLSVLCASLISGVAGFGYLWLAGREKKSR